MAGKRETAFTDEDVGIRNGGRHSYVSLLVTKSARVYHEKQNRAKAKFYTMLNIDHFRNKLLATREVLHTLADSRDASSATVVLDQSSVGRLSRMDALQQQAMAQDTRRRAELDLRRIAAALQRCEDGSYGYCSDCAETIDPRRLELDPALTLCIHCAEKRDL